MSEVTRYLTTKFGWFLRHPGFRTNPVAIGGRLALWFGYCAVGHAPQFPLMAGVRCKVDPVLKQSGSSSAFVMRAWAEPELRYLSQLIDRDATFIDVGANIGIYTLCAAAIVGTGGKVIAVEPGEASFNRLRANVVLNGFPQIRLVKKAISDSEATACLYHAGGGPVSFSLVQSTGDEFEEVETTTIDRLAAECGLERVDAIKLDVEGVEILALHGATETVRRCKPLIIFEATSLGAQKLGSPENVGDLLASQGYRLYRYERGAVSDKGFKSPNIVAIHPERGKAVPDFLHSFALG